MFGSFHFLRPWWFLAMIAVVGLFIYMLKRFNFSKSNWSEHCDPHLLPYIVVDNKLSKNIWMPCLILIAWIVSILALAGPTWSLYAQPVYQKNLARVIALDVSQSMNSTDVTPTRLQRAKYKVLDLLRDIKEGQTGMIVFSSEAFVVSPLTNDSKTIANMVPVLDSNIVPVQGSDISTALHKSAQLLKQAGFTEGQIILITDSKPSDKAIQIAHQLAKDGYTISVLAIGTKDGGPIQDENGTFVTDNQGNVVFAHLDSAMLEKLAIAGGGSYIPFSEDNSDWNEILHKVNLNELASTPSQEMETKSLWKDEGHWLIWLLIVLCAFIARKGWLDKIC